MEETAREYVFDRLREAREAAGLNVQDVAARTSIRADFLRALERGEFSALPERPIARSYLRRYASELRLDPAELLARHDQLSPPGDEIVNVMRGKMAARRRMAIPWSFVAGSLSALVVVLAALWWGYAAWQARDVSGGSSSLLLEPLGGDRTVRLTLSSDPGGARVFLDNRDLGQTPVRGFPLAPREQAELRVELQGYKPAVKRVDLSRSRYLKAKLVPEGAEQNSQLIDGASAGSGTAAPGVGERTVGNLR